ITAGTTYQTTLSATDAENDALVYRAFSLHSGMSFDPVTRVFTYNAPPRLNATLYTRFLVREASGGTDWQVVKFVVVAPQRGPEALAPSVVPSSGLGNPSRGPFVAFAPGSERDGAILTVLTVSGREVARVPGKGGSWLAWNGRNRFGMSVAPGVY